MKILSMITSNAENYTLDIINDAWDHFDRIIIVEGNFNEEVLTKYVEGLNISPIALANYELLPSKLKRYKNDKLWIVDRPWNDNYAEAYQAHLNLLEEGDWVLIVDSDEFPGELLKQNLDKIITNANELHHQQEQPIIIALPVVDWLDDESLWSEEDVPQEYQQGMWTKQILLRKGKNNIPLRYFGSHVIPRGDIVGYVPYPYLHKKKLTDFFHNEVFQWVLHPEGQLVDPIDAHHFREGLKHAGIQTMADMKKAVREGTIGDYLESMCIKGRHMYRDADTKEMHPWRQLYCLYYLYTDNGKEPPFDDVTLDQVKEDINFWKRNFHTYREFK